MTDNAVRWVMRMRVTVVRPSDLGPSEASLWARFQKSSPELQNPFFSLTFAQVVGRHRPNSRVAVVEADGAIQAFLPFDLGPQRIGVPIGDPMNNLQGFIGSGLPIDARWAVKQAHLRGWRFNSVPVDQRAFAPFHYEGTTVPCPVIDLTKGDLSHISERRKARRALEQQFGTVSLEWNSTQSAHIGQLIEWKCRKYYGTAQLFSDPTARSIVEELATSRSDDCHGIVSVLFAGPRPAAVHLGLLGPRSLVGWFTSYDPELSRLSPGMMLWSPLARAAEERGISQIDLGAGQDAYKFGLYNDSYMVAGGAVWVSGAEAAARKTFRRLRALSDSREA
jgi:CelD/BcsL family acetyltransferase involved in cellulose biosynthesis